MAPPNELNDHAVRNRIIEDIDSFGGFRWPADDEPVDVQHLQSIAANLVRLTQVLGDEIDTLRAELRAASIPSQN